MGTVLDSHFLALTAIVTVRVNNQSFLVCFVHKTCRVTPNDGDGTVLMHE